MGACVNIRLVRRTARYRAKAWVSILSLWLVATPSFAQSEDACEGTTYDVSVCLLRVLKKFEVKLNVTYRQAMKAATDNHRPQDVFNLKDAQRKWVAYRDAVCKAEYGLSGGGSGGPAERSLCLISMTKERIGDLIGLYDPQLPK